MRTKYTYYASWFVDLLAYFHKLSFNRRGNGSPATHDGLIKTQSEQMKLLARPQSQYRSTDRQVLAIPTL